MKNALHHAKALRLLECSAVCLFALLAAWSLSRLAVAADWRAIPLLLVAAPLGWLASDLLSGLLHWACDSFGSVHTPVVGNAFIRPFREHHIDPHAMTQHDFVETHGASCLAAMPFLAAASLMSLETPATLFAQALLLSIALGGLATNQCHKWAHMEETAVPAAVRCAQRCRLVLPPGQHRLHHTAPFDSHFCVSSGWLNAPFNALLRLLR